MNIELRRFKHCARRSEETNEFQADVYIDSVKVGTAENQGCGGNTFINPPALRARLDAYAATLPPLPADFKLKLPPMKMNAELVIDYLVNDTILAGKLKRLFAKRVIFTASDKPGIFQVKAKHTETIAVWLENPAAFSAKHKADKILNLLPMPEALAAYRAAAA